MTTTRRLAVLVIVLAAVMVRCAPGKMTGGELDAGGADVATPTDSGHDATSADAGPDAPVTADAGADATDVTDAGTDVTDAAHEAQPDATTTAPREAGATDGGDDDAPDASADAPVTPDAGPPVPMAPGTFACATCPGGDCDAGCSPGTVTCNGSCVAPSLDPANCGGCGNACATGDVCVLGVCTPRASTVLVSGIDGGAALALDATHVFYVDAAGVHSVPRAGGPVTNIADATGTPLRVAVDDTYAYWSETAGPIMRAPKDGSGAPSLVVTATDPQGIAVVGGTVYWVTNTGSTTYYLTQTIYQAPADGGAASVFATVPDPLEGRFSATIEDRYSLLEVLAVGTSLYVVDQGGAYQVPIGPDGGAEADGGVLSFNGLNFVNGTPSARPDGTFCGNYDVFDQLGYACSNGGLTYFTSYQVVEASALPTCGMVFTMLGFPQSGTVMASEGVLHGQGGAGGPSPDDPATFVLAPEQASVIAADGMTIVLLNPSGEIRILPLP